MTDDSDKPAMLAPKPMIGAPSATMVVGPVGQCIYCGNRPPEARLSKEHVIPRGIGGGFVLLASSCEECRLITHKFETTCLRGSFLPFRVKTGFQKRGNKERPTHFPIRSDPKVPGSAKLVSLDDYPTWLHLPLYPQPGLFDRRAHGIPLVAIKMATFANPAKMNEIAAKHGGTVSADVTFPNYEFMQMLAKIAHGMAWIEPGPENFRPFLTDLIRGIDKDPAYFIGQTTKEVEALPFKNPNPLHKTVLSVLEWDGMLLLTVRLQILSAFNTPIYYIVVGELTPTPDWLAQRGLVKEGAKIRADPNSSTSLH